MEGIKGVVQRFLFLNMITHHPEKLPGATDNRMLSRCDKIGNTVGVAFEESSDVQVSPVFRLRRLMCVARCC